MSRTRMRERDSAADQQVAAGEAALRVHGDLAAARAAFGRAFELAEQDCATEAMGRAALGLSGLWVHERRSAVDAANVEARQRRALSVVDPGSTLALRLRVRLAAEVDYRSGRFAELQRLLGEARLRGVPSAVAEGISLLVQCTLGPQHAELRGPLAEELLRAGVATGRPADTVLGLLWRSVDLFLRGDRPAERAYGDLLAHEPATRNAAVGAAIGAMQVMLTIRAGRLAEAEALAEEGAQAGAAAGHPDWMSWYVAQLVAIRWFQGRIGRLTDTLATIAGSSAVSVADNSFLATRALACAAAGDTRQARSALAGAMCRDLPTMPTSTSWLWTMAAAIEAAALLDDAAAAGRAHDMLLPYGHLPVLASIGVACLGSARQPLGIACLTTGDAEGAVDHLTAALEHNSALGHWPAAALARHRLAQAMMSRGAPGDGKAGTILFGEAAAEAAELGMRLPERAPRRGRPGPSPPLCTRRGRRWRIELAGRAADVEDMVGLRHLAVLLANPGLLIPAVDLAGSGRPGSGVELSGQPVLDGEALRRYRARLKALADEIGRAEAAGDHDRGTALRSEQGWLRGQVATGTGLGGRSAVSRTIPNAPA